MQRLTLANAEKISAVLNSTVGHYTEGKKVITVRAFAKDDTQQAGIEIVKGEKQLAVMAIDFGKRAIVMMLATELGKNALKSLLEENHASVFQSAQTHAIPIASYVAWEIVTDEYFIQSLLTEYEGDTLKAGQKFLKQIPPDMFDERVAFALSYLDLNESQLQKLGWVTETQKAAIRKVEGYALYKAYFNRLEPDEVPYTVNALLITPPNQVSNTVETSKKNKTVNKQ